MLRLEYVLINGQRRDSSTRFASLGIPSRGPSRHGVRSVLQLQEPRNEHTSCGLFDYSVIVDIIWFFLFGEYPDPRD